MLLLALAVLVPPRLGHPLSGSTTVDTRSDDRPLHLRIEYARLVGVTIGSAARCGADTGRLQVIANAFLSNANGQQPTIDAFHRAMEAAQARNTGEAPPHCGEAMARLQFLEEETVR